MASKAFKWTGLSSFKCRPVVNVKSTEGIFEVSVLHPNTGEVLHTKKFKKQELSQARLPEVEYFSLAMAHGNAVAQTLNIKTEEQRPASVYGKKRAKKNDDV